MKTIPVFLLLLLLNISYHKNNATLHQEPFGPIQMGCENVLLLSVRHILETQYTYSFSFLHKDNWW